MLIQFLPCMVSGRFVEHRANTEKTRFFVLIEVFGHLKKNSNAEFCYGLVYIIFEFRIGEKIYFVRIISVQLVYCKFFQLRLFVG